MVQSQEIEQMLLEHAVDRYWALARVSTSEEARGAGAAPAPFAAAFVAALLASGHGHGDAVLDWLEQRLSHAGQDALGQSAALFVDRTAAAIHEANQFIVIDPASRDALEGLYRAFLADLGAALGARADAGQLAGGAGAVLAAHHARLGELLDALWSTNLGHSFAQGRALCSEYSAELQCSILGIELAALAQPVLDLGCGQHALLVRYLRDLGVQAVGVDRGAAAGEGVIAADWFEYPLGQARWGTIVSHMALSNHFLHHHMRADGHPERYARLYMSVLGALAPGGRYVYAPGLPFLEPLLPGALYAVQTTPVARLAGSDADQALRAAFGDSVFYACQVTRRA
jgi:hypothetical protein